MNPYFFLQNPQTGKIPSSRLHHVAGDLPLLTLTTIELISAGLSRYHAFVLLDARMAYYQGTNTIDIDLTAIPDPAMGVSQTLRLGLWTNTPPSIATVHSMGHFFSRCADFSGETRGDLMNLHGFLLPQNWSLQLQAGTQSGAGGGAGAYFLWSFLFARLEWE